MVRMVYRLVATSGGLGLGAYIVSTEVNYLFQENNFTLNKKYLEDLDDWSPINYFITN